MKVLLIAPPYRPPNEGTLAIATLRPILEAHGHQVVELHGSTFFPNTGEVVPEIFARVGRFAFGRALRGCGVEEYVDVVLRTIVGEVDPHGVISPDPAQAWTRFGVPEERMRVDLRATLRSADVCLERIVARAVADGPYDVIGLSTMFTDHIPAAVVLARRFKALWPAVPIMFGGPVCFAEQGDALLASFPEVDVACHTEGEQVIIALVERLGAGGALADVPGIAWRDGATIRHNPSPPLLRELDGLPLPDYRGFIEQFSASEWAAGGADLFFETSRGCWWGEKSLCSFCGLNAEGLPFRAKSADRALAEIRFMHEAYPTAAFLRAADNIVDFRYLKTVFPRLRDLAQDPVRPLRLFYETKSNMKWEQVEALAAGGVCEVQPGIESFSDGVLKIMHKGCTALGQVQFVKWAHQAGMLISYNVLVLNPGEETSWYWQMRDLVPFIEHLPAPLGASSVRLDRFSRYHMTPELFGITNVRPSQHFVNLFGAAADPRLAYTFDFDHPMYQDEEHLTAVRMLTHEIFRWRADWKPDLAYYVDEGDRLILVDSRDGQERRTVLAGSSGRIYHYLDQNRTRSAIGAAFSTIPAEVIDALLLTWLHRRWICRDGDRYLAVLPRKGPARMAAITPPSAVWRDRDAVRLQTAV